MTTTTDTGAPTAPLCRKDIKKLPSRRSFLAAGLFAVPAAVSAAIIASPVEALPADRSRWDDLMRQYQDAEAQQREQERSFSQALTAYKAALPDEPDTRIFYPHHHLHVLNVADLDDLANEARSAGAPYDAARLAVLENIRAFRAEAAKADASTSYTTITDRLEEASERCWELQGTLMKEPAPDYAALLWKLEDVLTPDDGHLSELADSYVEPVRADMRRLLGGRA